MTCFKRNVNVDKMLFKAYLNRSWPATDSCFKRHLEPNNMLFKALKTRFADNPQYEIKSDKTEHVAPHKGAALDKIE